MKKLLFLLLLAWTTGNAQDLTGLSNQTIKFWTGGKILNCSNLVIESPIVVTPAKMDNSTGIVFNNPKFSRAGILIFSPTSGLRVYNFISVGVDVLVDCGPGAELVFTGNNYLLRNSSIIGGTTDGRTVLLGNQGAPYNNKGWIDSVTVSGVNLTSVAVKGMSFIMASGIYHFDFHHNRLNYPGAIPTTGGDYAMYSISGGNGDIHENFRSGGWGWGGRVWGVVVKGTTGVVRIWNNIDENKANYGGWDVRTEPAATNNLTTAANIAVVNNTCGNYGDIFGNYSGACALIANIAPGYTVEVKNNLSFNVKTKGYQGHDLGGNIGAYGGVNLSQLTTTNNLYFATYQLAGLANDTTCDILKGSPVIDAGVPTIAVLDYSGIKRPQFAAFDVGAREYPNGCPTCPVCQLCPPPVVCPADRVVKSVTYINGVFTFTYDRGDPTTLP